MATSTCKTKQNKHVNYYLIVLLSVDKESASLRQVVITSVFDEDPCTLCRGKGGGGGVCKIPPGMPNGHNLLALKFELRLSYEVCMKLVLLEKWHKEVRIFFLVSTPDGGVGGGGLYKQDTIF